MAEPRGAAPRSQAQRRSASEEALLDAAAELIAELGVERASFPKIGDRAGTSRGLPSHYFGSKNALVDRLTHRTQERILATVTAAVDDGSGPMPGLDRVRLTMDRYLQLFVEPAADIRALIVVWGATFPAASSLAAMHDADRRTFAGWQDAVRRGVNDGSIRGDVDVEEAAAVLLAMSRGFAALLLADGDLIGDTDVRATCDHWITTVLGPPGLATGAVRTSGARLG